MIDNAQTRSRIRQVVFDLLKRRCHPEWFDRDSGVALTAPHILTRHQQEAVYHHRGEPALSKEQDVYNALAIIETLNEITQEIVKELLTDVAVLRDIKEQFTKSQTVVVPPTNDASFKVGDSVCVFHDPGKDAQFVSIYQRRRERFNRLIGTIVSIKTNGGHGEAVLVDFNSQGTREDRQAFYTFSELQVWYRAHLPTCGTSFRGCDPSCPKEQHEQRLASKLPAWRDQ